MIDTTTAARPPWKLQSRHTGQEQSGLNFACQIMRKAGHARQVMNKAGHASQVMRKAGHARQVMRL